MGTSGGTGGNDGAVEASLGDDIDLDGGVTLKMVSICQLPVPGLSGHTRES